MIFTALPIKDAWHIELERRADDRGFFARTWCAQEFAAHGVESPMVQASLSRNPIAGTLRGLHYARPPAREGKLVCCTRGRIYDVLVDLRTDSASFGQHVAITLSEDDGNALYVPPGVAHGFQTLVDECTVHYMMTETYQPGLASGVRYNDPAFKIDWPLPVSRMSAADRAFPDFDVASARSTSPWPG